MFLTQKVVDKGIMWDAWGGSSGINWAINKLKQIDKK